MRLDELFGLGKSAKQKEQEVLAKKVKMFYEKALENFEEILAQNEDSFKKDPLESFSQWFEHFFERPMSRIIDTPAITNQIKKNTIQQLIKPLIMLGSQNFYLKPKTGYAGSKSLIDIAPMVAKNDRKLLAVIDKFFGQYVETGDQKKTSEVKVGTQMDWPDVGIITWKGRMWLTDKNQPLPKEMQGPATQKAIDDGLTT